MRYLTLLVCFFCILSCQSDKKTETSTSSQLDELTIRLDREPGLINPFYAPTTVGRMVYQYIFVPLADYHPETLKLEPILIEAIPEGKEEVIDGETFIVYDLKFKEDAAWPDGAPVTAKDYLFTISMIKHPNTKIAGWQPYFTALRKVELDETDSKKFRIFLDPNYMVALEAAVTIYLFPQHVYDPEDKLISLQDALFKEGYATSDSSEINLVERVNQSRNIKKEIFQMGPYELTDFQTDEYVILTAKENYWGKKYPDVPALQSNVKQIIMRVVPDEVTAINMAKEGKIDFMEMRSSNDFLKLKEDDSFNKDWTFHVPQTLRFYFLCLNNKSPIFSDKNVRKAFAHLIDVEDMMENIDGGLGVRTTGPFPPSKSYYDKTIEPVAFDIEKAKQVFDENGWKDTDGDGIRDKVINGKVEALDIDYLFTGSQLANKLGLLFQETAKSAGVKVNLVKKSMALMRKENLDVFDYDVAALSITVDHADDDPYSRWHSDAAAPGKRNVSGFSNEEADKLIETIRTTRDKKVRFDAYKELQGVFEEEQPVIFLYCPLLKFIINDKLEAYTTPKRPGYLANTFKPSN